MKAKDKIALLVSGKISLKEIQALEEQEAREAAEEAQAAAAAPQEPEVDYKKLYEELKAAEEAKHQEEAKEPEVDYKQLYEAEQAKVTKLQQANINQNLRNGDNEPESIDDIMIKAYSVPK